MNKNLKKILSVILCAVLLFTTASTAFAAEETETEVNEEVTETVREESLLEKIEAELDFDNIPWGFILYCIGYAFLLLFGTVISPFTLPISLVLILTGNAGW